MQTSLSSLTKLMHASSHSFCVQTCRDSSNRRTAAILKISAGTLRMRFSMDMTFSAEWLWDENVVEGGHIILLMDTKHLCSQVKEFYFEAEADRMLQSVHLVGEDEDDLYSGFNDHNPAFDTEVRSDVGMHMIFLHIDSVRISIKAYVVFSLYQEELKFD